ncbi:DUF4856 domain-containing protein [Ornithobacterium rhinotracheale]|uniref:DUF4856 domain-containing protein n=1 Tax=Ornithobacterium rhinotracheale TaxID=28251 RepID=UPI00129CE7D6|nr:DUF4856 domain-containing protein [Ornithobacterium rhinotracheale]MRI62931.1 DUF4856 domain-containing protein [Ornithobacterium rhinotracheale]
MIKKTIVALSILAGALMVSSCGGGSGSGSETIVKEDENKDKVDLSKDYAKLFPTNALSEGRRVIDNLLSLNDLVDRTAFSNQKEFNEKYELATNSPFGNISAKSMTASSSDLFKMNPNLQQKVQAKFNESVSQLIELNGHKWDTAGEGKAGKVGSEIGKDTRFVNGKGIEVSELVEKQIMGVILLDQILNEHLGDKIMKNSTLKSKNTNREKIAGKRYTELEYHWDMAYALLGKDNRNGSPVFIANYMVNEFQGAEFMKDVDKRVLTAFKKGRKALATADYSEVETQIGVIRESLSKLFATRCVHYLKQSKPNLGGDIASGEYQKAFHELSEAYGFLYAFIATRKADGSFYINDYKIIESLATDMMGASGLWDKNNLIGVEGNGALNRVAKKIGNIFGFDSDLVL